MMLHNTPKLRYYHNAPGCDSAWDNPSDRDAPDIIGQASPDSQPEPPNLERKCAEQKRYHARGQVRYRGLAKVTIQVLITCMVVNCNRSQTFTIRR